MGTSVSPWTKGLLNIVAAPHVAEWSTYRPVQSWGQGLTLVHIFAQPEPFSSLKPARHPITWDRKCSR
jgi:hypothetical protein